MHAIKRALEFIGLPLSNKVAVIAHVYWRLKTALIYKPMFKACGRRSIIYRPMMISNADCIEIGEYVTIRDGVRLEAIRDSYGRSPSLVIGPHTNIEQNVHIVCHSRIAIGRDVSITGTCSIVDTTHPYENIKLPKVGDQIANDDSYVEIGDGSFLGYGAVVLPNVRIGRRAVVGANSVVTRDVPDYSVVAGVPARIIKVYSHKEQRWIEPEKKDQEARSH
jgi:acetyltransferase-like isoleucine patch superfamily enzyme